jgi:signal transduction histidine kinase
VRAKAMAMQNSEDVSAAAHVMFSELYKLGVELIRCGILFIDESQTMEVWTTLSSKDGQTMKVINKLDMTIHPLLKGIFKSWKQKEEIFSYHLIGEDVSAYYNAMSNAPGYSMYNQYVDLTDHYCHVYYFEEGGLYTFSYDEHSEATRQILKKFAAVFALTFRRYQDLKKSEANAREAIKRAALDRIRADIASMRTVSDLDRITPLIWNELNILGVPSIRCGVFIMDESQKLIHTFLSAPDGKAIAAFHLPYDTPGHFPDVVNHWRNKKIYLSRWSEDDFISIAETLVKQGAIANNEEYLSTLPKGGFHLHFLPFLQGMLYVGNTTQLREEEIILIQHIADAFSTAYARYEDFNKLEAAKKQVDNTLNKLQATQKQLIQSEKMASLGELTAGIAHEIQNPLNFVNNFSEVSNELVDEMKTELATGNLQLATEIADDIKQNLEKINHHGKRADAIVKGMLQHSRQSSGTKQPTDIDALCDEYLRLSYHGMRAKDKSFNVEMKTGFDSSIGKINIIPQDIGRVLLNLYNNAFYATNEKKKTADENYQPTVSVQTKKINDGVEIRVEDNGNGIPASIKEKIFQPFFTTKPTGQGTGLGLSLAYDITKAHGGEIKVETNEGEGSEFIIFLP